MGELLKGKVAVVTGSGQGIGRGMAIYLAKEGAKVITNNRKPGGTGLALLKKDQIENLTGEQKNWVMDMNKDFAGDAESTAQTIRQMGGEATAFFGDVSKFDVAGKLIQTAVDTYGKIDILVNVAGIFRFCPIWEATEEIWDTVANTKPKAAFNCIRHAVPHMMKQKWGRILNCTSRAWAGDPLPHAHYAAANGAMVGLTRGVANELFHYGIMVNAFSPWAKTRASSELEAFLMLKTGNKQAYVEGKSMSNLENTPEPEELAPVIAYLSSDLANGISGTVFYLGGPTIGIHGDPDIAKAVTKSGGPWTIAELKEQLPATIFNGYHSRAENP